MSKYLSLKNINDKCMFCSNKSLNNVIDRDLGDRDVSSSYVPSEINH